MSKFSITLIITVLNEAETLDRLLQALAKQIVLPDETIIVDGGSTDQTFEKLERAVAQYPKLNLHTFQVKGNRSQGRNAAIKAARHDLIAITDAGCVPQVDWLQQLRKKVTEYGLSHAYLGGLIVSGYYDAKPQTAFEEAVVPYVLVMPDKVNPHVFLPATRSMLLHKAVWKAVNGFDESLSDNEDYDFARRIRELAKVQNQSGYENPIEFVFAADAKVTWLPRKNIRSFIWMIFRFARGDAQAGIWRPKVLLVFARYILGLLWGSYLLAMGWWTFFAWFLLLSALGYSAWAVQKNKKYVPHGWYWLPVLQVVSDIAILMGTVIGWFKTLWKKQKSA